MNLIDTIQWMSDEDYKSRLKAEYYQCMIRYTKLKEFLKKFQDGELSFTPTCSYDLLHTQLVHMKGYLDVLSERMRIENVK